MIKSSVKHKMVIRKPEDMYNTLNKAKSICQVAVFYGNHILQETSIS